MSPLVLDPRNIIPRLKTVWRVLSYSLVVYVVLAILTIGHGPPADHSSVSTVMPQAIFAIIDALISTVVYWAFLEPHRMRERLATLREQAPQSVGVFLRSRVFMYFLCWALNQAVAMQGFAIAQTAHSPGLLLPFVLGAAGLNTLTAPKLSVS